MTEQDRPFLVEMVTMHTGYSKSYCEKMSIKELEKYYFDMLEEGSEQ